MKQWCFTTLLCMWALCIDDTQLHQSIRYSPFSYTCNQCLLNYIHTYIVVYLFIQNAWMRAATILHSRIYHENAVLAVVNSNFEQRQQQTKHRFNSLTAPKLFLSFSFAIWLCCSQDKHIVSARFSLWCCYRTFKHRLFDFRTVRRSFVFVQIISNVFCFFFFVYKLNSVCFFRFWFLLQ